MRSIYVVLISFCLMLSGLAWYRGGWEYMQQGMLIGAEMLFKLLPLLVLAFTCAGLLSVLSSRHYISPWLGSESGIKGILLGALAGAVLPGGPFVFFPLAATLLISGAGIGPVISFVTAKNLWTVTRIPLEIALLGLDLTLIRYAVTFFFPILAGLAAHVLLQGQTDRLKMEISRLQGQRKHDLENE